MTKDWTDFWQSYRPVDIKDDQDLLYQAGKTVKGKVIDPAQFETIIKEIVKKLDLNKEDRLLDLCCGNGILTYELSQYVNSVTGIDFSGLLIQNAKKYKSAHNIRYYQKDIKDLDKEDLNSIPTPVNKILMYDALAYFSTNDLNEILKIVSEICSGPIRILIASVLDRRRRSAFFNTSSRKIQYLMNMRLLGNTKGIGKWWTPGELKKIGSLVKMSVKILDQNPLIFTSHYRLDVIFEKHKSA